VRELESELQVLRQTPTAVLQRIVLERAEAVEKRWKGTPEGSRAAAVLGEARKLWDELESRQGETELETMAEIARKHFAAGELGLAELFYRWVQAGDKAGKYTRECQTALKTIEGRRSSQKSILLQ
jgi:hypothetical protein